MDSKLLVLVVDDERALRRAVGRVLTDAGFVVLEADDGTSALRVIAETQPHLVITDLSMTTMHGDALIRALRGRLGAAAPTTMLMTAHQEGPLFAAEAGADKFMAKPFANDELLAAVRELLLEPHRGPCK